MARRILLACGIFAAALYIGINVIGALRYPGYSSISQTVSELGAIDAPSRSVVLPLTMVYDILLIAFGVGMWRSGGRNRTLGVMGLLMVVSAAFDAGLAPFASMHQRTVLAAGGGTLSDSLHLMLGGVDALFMFLCMGFGAAALGKRFRLYSIGSMVALVAFGAWMTMDSPRLQANLPTPSIGLTERTMILAYLLWMVVLSVTLLRAYLHSADPTHQANAATRAAARTMLPRATAHDVARFIADPGMGGDTSVDGSYPSGQRMPLTRPTTLPSGSADCPPARGRSATRARHQRGGRPQPSAAREADGQSEPWPAGHRARGPRCPRD